LSNDRQLLHRLASHKPFLYQFQLFEPLDDFFRETPVTDQPTVAEMFLPAEKRIALRASCCARIRLLAVSTAP
jgi:hypothetical protein